MTKDLVIGVLLIIVIALGAYVVHLRAPVSSAPSNTTTTTSDNSLPAAGGNNSTEPPEITLTAKANSPASGLGVTLAPIEVVEDSRCPTEENIKCIQAGTVRVRTKVIDTTGEKTMIFTLGTPVVAGTKTIELTSVLPAARAAVPIVLNEYRFVFKVAKRGSFMEY